MHLAENRCSYLNTSLDLQIQLDSNTQKKILQFKYSTTVKTVSKITVKPNKHFIKLKIFQIKFINNVVSHVFNN